MFVYVIFIVLYVKLFLVLYSVICFSLRVYLERSTINSVKHSQELFLKQTCT